MKIDIFKSKYSGELFKKYCKDTSIHIQDWLPENFMDNWDEYDYYLKTENGTLLYWDCVELLAEYRDDPKEVEWWLTKEVIASGYVKEVHTLTFTDKTITTIIKGIRILFEEISNNSSTTQDNIDYILSYSKTNGEFPFIQRLGEWWNEDLLEYVLNTDHITKLIQYSSVMIWWDTNVIDEFFSDFYLENWDEIADNMVHELYKYQLKNIKIWGTSRYILRALIKNSYPIREWWKYVKGTSVEHAIRVYELVGVSYQELLDMFMDTYSDDFEIWYNSNFFVHAPFDIIQYHADNIKIWWDPKLCWVVIIQSGALGALYKYCLNYKNIWSPKV